jgi:hypothetical protein
MAELAEAAQETRIRRLAELAASFLVLPASHDDQASESPLWLAEFALRLASSPKDAAIWAGPRLRPATTKVLEVPILARAARFMVIGTDRHLQSRTAPGELYASWGWE